MLSEVLPKSLLNGPVPLTPTIIRWEPNSSLNAMISSTGFSSLRWACATVAPLSSIRADVTATLSFGGVADLKRAAAEA
jgi:hypothetical protein